MRDKPATATYVVFDDGARVPIGEAFAYADAGRYVWPSRVEWSTGGWSYAKGWYANFDAGYVSELVRVGAGAYGDTTVLSREPRTQGGAR